jgi:hypothetical protein
MRCRKDGGRIGIRSSTTGSNRYLPIRRWGQRVVLPGDERVKTDPSVGPVPSRIVSSGHVGGVPCWRGDTPSILE